MPDKQNFLEYIEEYQRWEITSHPQIVFTPELEQAIRKIVREEFDAMARQMRIRFGASGAEFTRLETK